MIAALAVQHAAGQTVTNIQTLPFYESFPGSGPGAYLQGEELGSGNGFSGTSGGTSGSNWVVGNSVSSSCGHIYSNVALAYPGFTNTPGSYGLSNSVNTGSSKNRGILFSPKATTNVTLYASFLLNIQANPGTGNRAIVCLSDAPTNEGSGFPNMDAVVYVNAQNGLVIAKNTGNTATAEPPTNATPTAPLLTNNTYLVVFRYKPSPGTNADEVDLWINPTPLGVNTTIPPPTISSTTGTNASGVLDSFYYLSPSGAPVVSTFIDEIHISTNWSDVTQPTASPGGLYTVTGGGSVCTGGSFPVGLSDSDATVTYLLYTNGVATGASVTGTGSGISFGLQTVNALYTVLASNNVSGNLGWMSSNAVVSIIANAGIAQQPSSIIVANGGLGVVSMTASGGNLSYHWRRNGVDLSDANEFSGTATPNLVISPATAADAATPANGYDVVVTNTCGTMATSSRVGLTIDSPAHLVWFGDGVSNLWDVATSTNWDNNGSVNTAVFNFGDDVTFDDTAGNLGVTLASPYLSPSVVVVNSAQQFTFGGNGSIIGPGSLIMENSGILIISNANAYTGGTIISNGTVTMMQSSSLGSGPITLAGGTVSEPNLAGFTIENVINVNGDGSTIEVVNTSTTALILAGVLNGNSGSLTFYNGTSGRGPTVQLTASNFTFNLPIIFNLGATGGTNLLLQGENNGGSQIFNGIISGGGSVRRDASGGSTILNATNTFTAGTIIANGSVGVGVDSVSTAFPTIDSGPVGTGTLFFDTGNGTPELFASGGAHTVGNPVTWTTTNAGPALVFSGSNALTLSGAMDLGGTNRSFTVDNTGGTVLSGVITDDGLTNGVTFAGTDTVTVAAANIYTGPTIVSNCTLLVNGQISTGGVSVVAGTLGGSGSILGPVTVASGATLAPGTAAIGTLTVNSNVSIAGDLMFKVKKLVSPSNDTVVVTGTLANTGTGTLTVTNLGPALAVGDKFTLFSKPLVNGAALTVTGGGVTWSNNLAGNGSISVAAVGAPKPPVITSVSVMGGDLVFSGTNGSVGGTFYVLASTNLALPPSSWTVLSTNSFAAGGLFSITNAISAGLPARFYMLAVP
jgi:autotransporter-associated beta strand protein